jgi:hypothetical protein
MITEMWQLKDELNKAVDLHRERGIDLANKEKDYKILQAKKLTLLVDKGMKVTVVLDICHGDEEVAKLRQGRDIAAVLYDNSRERINSIKLQIRVLEEQIKREWARDE